MSQNQNIFVREELEGTVLEVHSFFEIFPGALHCSFIIMPHPTPIQGNESAIKSVQTNTCVYISLATLFFSTIAELDTLFITTSSYETQLDRGSFNADILI